MVNGLGQHARVLAASCLLPPRHTGEGDRTKCGRTGPTATIIALARRRGSQTCRDCDTDPSADLDKIHNTLDVLEDLLFRFIAFGGLCRQPSAAGRKQVFKGVADHGIGLKVPADHGESSVITIRSRLIVTANGVAQANEQSL